jgi:hypothetical protein
MSVGEFSDKVRVERKILGFCDELIEREVRLRKSIKDMNCVGWGMCTGAIDALEELKRWIVEEEP